MEKKSNDMSHIKTKSGAPLPSDGATGMLKAALSRLGQQSTVSMLSFIIVAYIVVVSLISPDFLSWATAFDLVRSGAAWMIVALGVLVVMISGGIDVSFLANAILSAYVATVVTKLTGIDSLSFAILIAVAVGALVGTINGLIIHLFSLPTLITTLAMQGVIHGFLMVFLNARPITAGRMPSSLRHFGTDTLFEFPAGAGYIGLSVFVVPLILAIFSTWYLLNRTAIGRAIYAVGSNKVAAMRAGVNLLKVNLVIYGYAGALAGLMGLMMVSDVRLVDPTTLIGNELLVLAAAIIGGAKLTGGAGSVPGVLLGMTLVTLLSNTLVTIGLSASWSRFFIGFALVLIASISHYQTKRRNLRQLNFENV